MQAIPRASDPLRISSALSPALFALGDPDRFVEMLNSNPAGVVLVEAGPELTVVYCNDAFQRWAPLGGRQVVGRPLLELFAWNDRAAIRGSYREAVRTGRPVHWRSAPYREHAGGAGGGVAYWNVSHYPLCGPAGRVTHVLTFTVDVTDQASVRARLREAQGRVLAGLGGIARHLDGHGDVAAFFGDLSRSLTELVPAARAAFWLYDAEAGTISAQAGAAGFAPEQLERLRGVPCAPGGEGLAERIVFHDLVLRDRVDEAGADASAYRSALRAAGVADTISMPWRAGERRLGVVGVYDSTRLSGFGEDDVWVLQAAVTAAALVWEHRQSDTAVAELREREAAGLRQQIEQSMQLEQLKTDFLKLASHELRGPLGVVRGYISMMEDGTLAPVGEQVGPVLPLLRAKLDEMNRLINEMLETARLDDSALELQVARLDLRDVVHEAVRSLEPLAGARHRLVTETPGASVEVTGDNSRLNMIVTNLVHNAIKYSPDGGQVRVSCRTAGDHAEVAVTDEGVGIAADDLGRLFTRFGRIATPETAQIAGTGLGLYLARDLAHRHGGEVGVVSEPGVGSTFTLTLPLATGR
jgi:signal transduction histidine kinase